MFCTQCGTNNPEGANNCVTCGAALGTPAPRKNDFASKVKSLLSNKLVLIGIGAAALVIVLLLIFGGSKTTPINNFYNGIAKANASKVMSAFPKDLLNELDIEKDDVEDVLDDLLDELEDEYGKNVKITFKKTDEEKWDKDDVEDYAEYLDDYCGLDEDKVTAVYTIEGKVTIKGSEEKDTNKMEIIVFKYKGKWYLEPGLLYRLG